MNHVIRHHVIRHHKRHHIEYGTRNYIFSIVFVAVLFLIDFITKFFVGRYVPKNGLIDYSINTGVAFSLFSGYNWLFILISIAVVIFIIYLYKNYPHWQLGLGFILAGALGNLFDRICYGHVIDFIDLTYWPVFNLADVFVVVGVIIIVYKLCFCKG